MRKTLAVLAVLVLTVGAGFASTTNVAVSYSGWYNSLGNHSYSNTNYFAGNHFGPDMSNFFLFDLTGISGTVNSAAFTVYSYGISAAGTYTIYGSSLSTAVQYDCGGCTATFAGLTSGPAIGSIALNGSNQYTWLTITLNSAGLSWLQANEGGWVVMGGGYPQPNNGYDNFAFGYSGSTPGNQLTLDTTPTPEPGTILMLGSGLVGLAGVLRRKLML